MARVLQGSADAAINFRLEVLASIVLTIIVDHYPLFELPMILDSAGMHAAKLMQKCSMMYSFGTSTETHGVFIRLYLVVYNVSDDRSIVVYKELTYHQHPHRTY